MKNGGEGGGETACHLQEKTMKGKTRKEKSGKIRKIRKM
jgi:hypothetical protein